MIVEYNIPISSEKSIYLKLKYFNQYIHVLEKERITKDLYHYDPDSNTYKFLVNINVDDIIQIDEKKFINIYDSINHEFYSIHLQMPEIKCYKI